MATLDIPMAVDQHGFNAATASVGDIDGDGLGDVVVNIPVTRSPLPIDGIRSVVLLGADGSGR